MSKKDWANHLRLRHLRVLMSLHDTCNLSKTARSMAMTQPALSKWLKELEDELGEPLFTRHSRGLIPTEACGVLAERSRIILNELDETTELLDALRDGVRGKLHIGSTPSASTDIVPIAIAATHTLFPKAMVVVREGPVDVLLPQLLDGRLNVIVSILEDRGYGDDIAQTRLYREHMVVTAGAHHPLQGKRKVTWEMALQYPWINVPKDSLVFRELQHELALAHQPVPRFVGDVSSAVLTSNILLRTQALALMSSRSAAFFEKAGVLKILKIPTQRTTYVGALRRKKAELGPLGDEFMRQLQAASEHLPSTAARRSP